MLAPESLIRQPSMGAGSDPADVRKESLLVGPQGIEPWVLRL